MDLARPFWRSKCLPAIVFRHDVGDIGDLGRLAILSNLGAARVRHGIDPMSSKKKLKAEQERPPEPWRIHFFRRHRLDDPGQSSPATDFIADPDLPPKVEAVFQAVLDAVAEAPPPAYSGGGKWKAMHDAMSGYYEVRVDGPQRKHYRLFCLLEREGAKCGLGGPSIVVITGMMKDYLTVFSEAEYAQVRELGDEYRERKPRSIARRPPQRR